MRFSAFHCFFEKVYFNRCKFFKNVLQCGKRVQKSNVATQLESRIKIDKERGKICDEIVQPYLLQPILIELLKNVTEGKTIGFFKLHFTIKLSFYHSNYSNKIVWRGGEESDAMIK